METLVLARSMYPEFGDMRFGGAVTRNARTRSVLYIGCLAVEDKKHDLNGSVGVSSRP